MHLAQELWARRWPRVLALARLTAIGILLEPVFAMHLAHELWASRWPRVLTLARLTAIGILLETVFALHLAHEFRASRWRLTSIGILLEPRFGQGLVASSRHSHPALICLVLEKVGDRIPQGGRIRGRVPGANRLAVAGSAVCLQSFCGAQPYRHPTVLSTPMALHPKIRQGSTAGVGIGVSVGTAVGAAVVAIVGSSASAAVGAKIGVVVGASVGAYVANSRHQCGLQHPAVQW